jgi:hypothetical protein
MEGADERNQARFIKWTQRPDVRTLAPELYRIFHWVPDCRVKAVQNKAVRGDIYNSTGPAFLMLANEDEDIRVALEFKNVPGVNFRVESHWLRHLTDSEWVVCVVQGAEEARVVVMEHWGKDLPPL